MSSPINHQTVRVMPDPDASTEIILTSSVANEPCEDCESTETKTVGVDVELMNSENQNGERPQTTGGTPTDASDSDNTASESASGDARQPGSLSLRVAWFVSRFSLVIMLATTLLAVWMSTAIFTSKLKITNMDAAAGTGSNKLTRKNSYVPHESSSILNTVDACCAGTPPPPRWKLNYYKVTN